MFSMAAHFTMFQFRAPICTDSPTCTHTHRFGKLLQLVIALPLFFFSGQALLRCAWHRPLRCLVVGCRMAPAGTTNTTEAVQNACHAIILFIFENNLYWKSNPLPARFDFQLPIEWGQRRGALVGRCERFGCWRGVASA